jgi:integrating conjugative element protein (TIGR03757 family)
MKSIFCISVLFLSSLGFSEEIQVFGLSGDSFQNLDGTQPCLLDQAEESMASVNQALKENPSINPNELSSVFSREFQTISDSLTCRYEAKALHVEKLPAIVFDRKFVVYGEWDLRRAKSRYETYQESVL